MFTAAQREGILAEARANIAARANVAKGEPVSSRQPDIVYKDRIDGAVPPERAPERRASVASESELPWWQWVDARIENSLEAHEEAVGTAMGEYVACQIGR